MTTARPLPYGDPAHLAATEVLSWFAVDAAAPEDFKRRSYTAYLMCFGSSGMSEQGDVENGQRHWLGQWADCLSRETQ